VSVLVFDIETGPLPPAEIEPLLPPFDEADVRVGNIKDPDKIAAKIAEAKDKQRRDFFDRAALDPMTGQILAIGYMDGQILAIGYMDATTEQWDIHADAEVVLLNEFWDRIRSDHGTIQRLIGFNVLLFDLPFLVRRSWRHGIPIPAGVRDGRYFNRSIVDLRDGWQLGNRQAHGSLDSICKFLGLGQKAGDGKDFAHLLETDRDKAFAYLEQDLKLTRALARRLGVI
jgi:hypothetical protein